MCVRYVFGCLVTYAIIAFENGTRASEEDNCVASKLIFIFYHDLGHVVI